MNYKGIELTYKTDPYGSHQPALIYAIENSVGNILELGTGVNSTPLLQEAIKKERKLISIDDDCVWINKFEQTKRDNHRCICIENNLTSWTNIIDEYSKLYWGVVFVDHASIEAIWRPSRPYAVKKLIDTSDYVVAHDADLFPEMKNSEYNWIEFVPSIQAMPNRRGPSTYIFSKKFNLNDLDIENLIKDKIC